MPTRIAFAIIAGSALVVFAALPAWAETYDRTTLDDIVLHADAIVFGTVVRIEPRSSPSTVADVELSLVRLVTARWPIANGGSLVFPVDGTVVEGSIQPLNHQPALSPQRRYLLFLRGGAWRRAPLSRKGPAVYPLRNDGVVECAGGLIFGLGTHGLLCSTAAHQAGAPLTEDALHRRLRGYLAAARRRRPSLAAEYDRQFSPPQTDPTHR